MEMSRQPSISSTLETLAYAFDHSESDSLLKRKLVQDPAENKVSKRRFSNHSSMTKVAVGLRDLAKKIGEQPLKWENGKPTNVMIVSKPRDSALNLVAMDLATWLMKRGLIVHVQNTVLNEHSLLPFASNLDFNSSSIKPWTDTNTKDLDVDFVITLGGDGTVLYACWLFQEKAPPIVPFNLGSLGFLTVFQLLEFEHILNHILANDDGMRMNFRMRFNCTIHRHLDENNKRADDHLESFQVMILIGFE